MRQKRQKALALLLVIALSIGNVLPAFAEEGSGEPTPAAVPVVETATQAPAPTPTQTPEVTAEPDATAEPIPDETTEPIGTADPLASVEPTLEPPLEPAPFDLSALRRDPDALRAAALASSAFDIELQLAPQMTGVATASGKATARSLPEDITSDSLTWILLADGGKPGLSLTDAKGNTTENGESVMLAFDGDAAAGTYALTLVCATPDGRMALKDFLLDVAEPVYDPEVAELLMEARQGEAPTFGIQSDDFDSLYTFYFDREHQWGWSAHNVRVEKYATDASGVSFSMTKISGTANVDFDCSYGAWDYEDQGSPEGGSYYDLYIHAQPKTLGTATYRFTCTQDGLSAYKDFTFVITENPSGFPSAVHFEQSHLIVNMENGQAYVEFPRVLTQANVPVDSRFKQGDYGTQLSIYDPQIAVTHCHGNDHREAYAATFYQPGRYTVIFYLHYQNLYRQANLQIVITEDDNTVPDSPLPVSLTTELSGYCMPFPGYFEDEFFIKQIGLASLEYYEPLPRLADEDFTWILHKEEGSVGGLALNDWFLDYSETQATLDAIAPTSAGTIDYTVEYKIHKKNDPDAVIYQGTVPFQIEVPDRLIPTETLRIGVNDTKRKPVDADTYAQQTDGFSKPEWNDNDCYFNGTIWIAVRACDMYFLLHKNDEVVRVIHIIASGAPTAVQLNSASITLSLGDPSAPDPQTFQLAANLVPATAASTITYSTSKLSVASVTAEGLIKAEGIGDAVITIKTANGKTATCKVKVVQAPMATDLDKTSLQIGAGESFSLTATCYSDAAKKQKLTGYAGQWKSSDSTIAQVDRFGLVTAKTPGPATISFAPYENCPPALEVSCQVEVCDAPTGMALSLEPLSVGMKQDIDLVWQGSPEAYCNQRKFISSNTKIATVDAAGKVTAVKAGNAIITVTTGIEGLNGSIDVEIKAAPTGVSLNAAALTLNLGTPGSPQAESFQLVAGSLAAGTPTTFTYTTSNAKVATVTSTGLIEAVGAGAANITVKTHNGKASTCKVTVIAQPPALVTLDKTDFMVGAGEVFTLTATAYQDTNKKKKLTGCLGVWSSSNEAVAAVDQTGKVTTLIAAPNPVAITYTPFDGASGGVSATCLVMVRNAPEGVTLTPGGSDSFSIGMTLKIRYALQGNDPYTSKITYTSSNPKVATVDATGTIKGVKTGDATIKALTAIDGIYGSIDIAVANAPTGISLNQTSLFLSVTGGESNTPQSFQLVAWFLPENTPASVTWTSSNPKVVRVEADGTVFALKEGTANITVKTHNGKSAVCKVTVGAPPAAVKITPVQGRYGVGEEFMMTVSSYSDAAMTAKKLIPGSVGTWWSADPTIADFTQFGRVTAKAPGEVEIYYKSYNGLEDHTTVTIDSPPTSMFFDLQDMSVGMTQTIQPEFSSGTGVWGFSGNVKYGSSDPKIASVNANGKVTALKAGPVTVTAKTGVPGLEASVIITVSAAPTGVKLNATALTMSTGDATHLVPQSFTLEASALPAGIPATFTYATNNKAVATVDEDGNITALKSGSATITVKAQNGKSAICKVTVLAPLTGIGIFPFFIPHACAGESFHLDTIGYAGTDVARRQEYANCVVTWESSDTSVATVDSIGNVQTFQPGSATITCKTFTGIDSYYDGYVLENGDEPKAECEITVGPAPTRIDCEMDPISVGMSEYYVPRLFADVEGTMVSIPYCYGITYRSSNTAVATIANNGKITAKKQGFVRLTATAYNGVEGYLDVEVSKAPDRIFLLHTAVSLHSAETYTIQPFVANGAPASYSFTSSNKAVATVNEFGEITALKAGTATITVKTHNGKSATIKVTVLP